MKRWAIYLSAIVFVVGGAVSGVKEPESRGAGPALDVGDSSDAALPELPKVIAGKPYSVTPGKVAGTFDVKWGDESMTWKPEPWMLPRYARLGPRYYAQWIRPGMPRPFEVPVAQRDKIPAPELIDRCLGDSYFPPYVDNGWDSFTGRVFLPDGSLRTETKAFEFYTSLELGKGREYTSASQANKVKRLYLWQSTEPEELRAEGGITTIFNDLSLEAEDTLYLPTVRKMRRLAGAVAKQYFPGTILRYEDDEYTFPLPELNYRVIGTKLFNPAETLRGYGPKDYADAPKRIGDAGDVDIVIEITPKPGVSWWYAKRLYYCGMLTMFQSYSEEYDANGKQIRYLTHLPMTGSVYHMGGPSGPPAPDWYVLWGSASAVELTSGFVQDSWTDNGGFDAKVSPSIFSADTLLRQSLMLSEWLQ